MAEIKIGGRCLSIPLIQGGMGVGVSMSNLAGSVAGQGGMGVISAAQIGFMEEDFAQNARKANLRVLAREIHKAKALAGGRGMVGVNIMCATQGYEEYVAAAVEAGADAIISGAGLPTALPELAAGSDVALAPIVSSAKSASVVCKYWEKRYRRWPDFVVIEGPLAGGHLGFSPEEIGAGEAFVDRVGEILEAVRDFAGRKGSAIPVFLAGGIFDAEDIRKALALGADGVQIGTRFVATEECDAHPSYKQAFVDAGEGDVAIIKSPVGMPGRALRNAFVEKAALERIPVRHCYQCIKTCQPATTPYCISKALIDAVKGDAQGGLVFCGAKVGRIKAIVPVEELVRELSVGWA